MPPDLVEMSKFMSAVCYFILCSKIWYYVITYIAAPFIVWGFVCPTFTCTFAWKTRVSVTGRTVPHKCFGWFMVSVMEAAMDVILSFLHYSVLFTSLQLKEVLEINKVLLYLRWPVRLWFPVHSYFCVNVRLVIICLSLSTSVNFGLHKHTFVI